MQQVGLCYCDDGSTAAAILYRTSEGFRLHHRGETLGHGEAEYPFPVGLIGASRVLLLNSTSGHAWAYLSDSKFLERGCLVHFRSDLPPIVHFDVDPSPDVVFAEMAGAPGFEGIRFSRKEYRL